jgi:hypothetical protein
MNRIIIAVVLFVFLSTESQGQQIQWEKTFEKNTLGHRIIELEDHGFLHVSHSMDRNHGYLHFNRLDSLRNEVWECQMSVADNVYPILKILNNQGDNFTFFVYNTSRRFYYFTEVSAEGDSVTCRRFEDDLEEVLVHPLDAIMNSEGHYLVLIGSEPIGFDTEFFIREYDQDYNLIEEYILDGPQSGLKLTNLTELPEGGYFVVGVKNDDIDSLRVLLKIDEELNVSWRRDRGRDMGVDVHGIGKLHENIYGCWGGRDERYFLSLFDSDGNIYPDSLYIESRILPLDFVAYGNDSYLYAFKYDREGNPDTLQRAKAITLFDSGLDSVESRFWLHADYRHEFEGVMSCSDGGVLISTQTDVVIDRALYYKDHLIKIAPPGWVPNHVEENIANPAIRFELVHAFPNPFNSTTTISYTLPQSGHVKLSIHDIQGREITVLQNTLQTAGYKKTIWNAGDQPSGLYFCRLESKGKVATTKLMLVK